jgi:hypothetical protein
VYLRLGVSRRRADPDEDVRELVRLVDEPTRSFLEKSLALGPEVVAPTIEDRERILWALEDVRTEALAELRAVLLQEHEWRRREGSFRRRECAGTSPSHRLRVDLQPITKRKGEPHMRRTLVLIAAFCAVALLAASSAFAGERGGSGKVTGAPDHAGSICAFSGLEDFETDRDVPIAPVQPGVVQHPAPGDLHGGDNPCRGFASGGGGEG